MGPPTVAQRVEQLEEKLSDLEGTVTEMVSKAVERAMEAMHHSLSEMLLEGQAKATKQLGTDLESLAGRLEGRVQRSREYHESLINSLKNDQLSFQAEMRSSVTGIQLGQVHRQTPLEGSVNKGGGSPSSLAVFVGSENLGQVMGNGHPGGGSNGHVFEGGGYAGFGGLGGTGVMSTNVLGNGGVGEQS